MLAFLAVVAPLAAATTASGQSLAMAPAEIRATFKPAEPIRFDVTVSNEGNEPVGIRATVTDLWYNEKNEKVFGAPGSQPRSAADWIEFVPRNFTIPAQGSGTVSVVITPPPDASGGYYAVLFVESAPRLVQPATADGRPLYASVRLGALVLLSAEGTEKYAIDVDEPEFTPPTANQHLVLRVQATNKSNSHIFLQPRLAILNRAGHQLVAKTQGEPQRFLPGQKDTLNLGWSGSLPPGEYDAILTLVYGDGQVVTREFPFAVALPGAQVAGQPEKP